MADQYGGCQRRTKWKDVRISEVPEAYFRDLLAEQEEGRIEISLATGKADVMTNSHVFEVERVGTWRIGLRQAVKYGTACMQRPVLALVADLTEWRRLPAVWAEVRAAGVEVWWFAGGCFVPIANSEQAEHYAAIGARMAEKYGEPASAYGRVVAPALRRSVLAREQRLQRAALNVALTVWLCERSGLLLPGASLAAASAIRLCWLAIDYGRCAAAV